MERLEEIWNEAVMKFPESMEIPIRRYLSENNVSLDYLCDDGALTKIKEKFIPGATWAGAVITPDRVHVAFAGKFLSAPPSVRITIIHHELIHIFLSPALRKIERHRPLSKDGRELIKSYREGFERISSLRHDKRSASNEYEEALVSFINSKIGNDEEEAKRLFSL